MNGERFHLHRDAERRWIAGVCAGLADYFDLPVGLVRIGAVLGGLVFPLPTLAGYVVLALALPLEVRPFAGPAEERFHRGLATAPADTLSELGGRFAAIDRRIARMEALVASRDYELHRGFRDLGG